MKKYLLKFPQSAKELASLKVLISSSMLTALYVVASLFLNFYMPWSMGARISFGFLFLAAAGMLFGPVPAMIVGGLGDVLAYVISPHGAFSYGITLCTVLMGLVFGVILYKAKPSVSRCTIAAVTQTVLIDLLAKTYVLKFLYGLSFVGMLSTRILTIGVAAVEMLILLPLVLSAIDRITKGIYRN